MKEEYRQVFDQVHASERLREEVAQMTKLERRNPKKRFPKGILIAAAILAVLAGSAIATVGMPGTLQGWFAQQWTEQNDTEMSAEQLAFIDHLTEQVGVQDTQNDVTVTLDSVTAGDSSIWLLLKISGSYEEDEEHRYDFGMVDLTLDPDPNLIHDTPGGSGLQTLYSGTASDGVFTVLLQYTIDLAGKSTLLDEPRSATLVLEDLNRKEIGGDWEGTPAAEGTWTLAFSLTPGEERQGGRERSQARSPGVQDRSIRLSRQAGRTTIREVRISATEIQYVQAAEEQAWEPERAALVLRDGSVVKQSGGNCRFQDAAYTRWSSTYYWRVPVDLSQVEALRIGDETFPLE